MVLGGVSFGRRGRRLPAAPAATRRHPPRIRGRGNELSRPRSPPRARCLLLRCLNVFEPITCDPFWIRSRLGSPSSVSPRVSIRVDAARVRPSAYGSSASPANSPTWHRYGPTNQSSSMPPPATPCFPLDDDRRRPRGRLGRRPRHAAGGVTARSPHSSQSWMTESAGWAAAIGSAWRCTTFQVPSSGRKTVVTRNVAGVMSSRPPILASMCSISTM